MTFSLCIMFFDSSEKQYTWHLVYPWNVNSQLLLNIANHSQILMWSILLSLWLSYNVCPCFLNLVLVNVIFDFPGCVSNSWIIGKGEARQGWSKSWAPLGEGLDYEQDTAVEVESQQSQGIIEAWVGKEERNSVPLRAIWLYFTKGLQTP